MKKFIGFEVQNGEFTNQDTGEVIYYSNRLLRFLTDDDMNSNEFGIKTAEQKIKSIQLLNKFNLYNESTFPTDTASRIRLENSLTDFLFKHFNKFVELDITSVKGKFEVVGFHVVEAPAKK